MHTVMATSSREDTQHILPKVEEVDPLVPTEIFFKEEQMPIDENEITPLTPIQVFPKAEPVSSEMDEMTVLTPLQVFPKEEPIFTDENEMMALAPLQVFPKEEPISDQLTEVVPLMPIQVFVKGEPITDTTEEPVFASLAAVIPKEEPEENVISDASSEDSRSLVINLENSSEASAPESDPLMIDEQVHSYVSDYTDRSDNLVINVEDPTRQETDPLRLSDDSGQILLDSGESTSSDSLSQDSSKGHPFQCMLCRKSFCSAISLQIHKQGHTDPLDSSKHIFDKLIPQLIVPQCTTRDKHECSNCGKTFAQLQMLMRHRLAHINAALHKPFSSIQTNAAGTSSPTQRAGETSSTTKRAAGKSSATKRAARASPPVPHRRKGKGGVPVMRHHLAHLNATLHKPFSNIQTNAAGTSSTTKRAAGKSSATKQAARASPPVPHRRKAQKRTATDQQTTVSTRHRRKVHRRRLS